MKQKKEPLAQQYQQFAKDSIDFMTSENWLTHLKVNGKSVSFTKPTAYRTEKRGISPQFTFCIAVERATARKREYVYLIYL